MPTLIKSLTDAVLDIKTVVTLLVSAITAAFVVGTIGISKDGWKRLNPTSRGSIKKMST
jgi:hypothetical protein